MYVYVPFTLYIIMHINRNNDPTRTLQDIISPQTTDVVNVLEQKTQTLIRRLFKTGFLYERWSFIIIDACVMILPRSMSLEGKEIKSKPPG